MSKKTTIEEALSAPEAGDPDEAKMNEALKKAAEAFFASLRASGVQPLTAAGSYDRGGCGHDRSK